jgi:hypothetical protein
MKRIAIKKKLVGIKVCPQCKKEHSESWVFCSNECALKCHRRQSDEGKLLKLMLENLEMSRRIYFEQLKQESYNTTFEYLEKKRREEEFDTMWYSDIIR